MLKRCTLLLLVCTLLTGWLCPARAEAPTPQARKYQSAQADLRRYLNGEPNDKTLAELCADFESLGRYQKSMSFLYYTSLLRDAEAEDFSQAEVYILLLQYDADFGELLAEAGFPSVAEVEAYVQGRMAEASHDHEGAIAHYQKCGAMLDSLSRMRRLLLATPMPSPVPTVTPTHTPKPTPTPTKKPAPSSTNKATSNSTLTITKKNVKVEEYTIIVYSNNTCIITGYSGKATKLSIPRKIGGYSVTSISTAAFNGCTSLISVTIPNSVTSIGELAFSSCTSLTSIHIPNSVTSIRDCAFQSCTNLNSVTIPNSVTSIGEYAFYYCYSLTSITIPDSITSIGDYAFYGCSSLTSITIPDSVTSIGYEAFYGCDSLTSITIPNSVTSIGDDAFYSCDSLTSITIPNSVTSIGDYTFYSCDSLTSITIPDSVTSIGNDAFYGCPNLTLRVKANSHAHQYAIDNSLPYTTY